MSESNAVIVQEPSQVAPNPLAMVADAIQRGTDPATIKALMDLADRYEATEARKLFNVAFNAFKAEAVSIVRSTKVTDGPLKGKKYADKYAIVSAVTAALAKNGLSASWRLTKDERDWMEVTCTLRHSQGHSEQVSMGGPPDVGPGRNAIQARSSTNSYLEKITLKAICGLAEHGDDTDGVTKIGMADNAIADWQAAIGECGTVEATDALWQKIAAATTAAHDVEAHEALKASLLAKRKALKKPAQEAI